MSKIETAVNNIKQENNEENSTDQEQRLVTELQLVSMLRENSDILNRHPELLMVLEVAHQSGGAVSLIERQVAVLRSQLQEQEKRMLELMDVARDNERLSAIRHRLAIDLFSAHDTADVVSTVLDTFKTELSADHAVVRLFSKDRDLIKQSAGLFVDVDDAALMAFKTMLQHKNTVCGRSTREQKEYLFAEKADEIKSVAIVPLIAGANLGLIGLGANDAKRFNSSMGTDFLSQIGELVSASLAVHLEQ